MRSGVPDLSYELLHVVAGGDLVAFHTLVSGTHTGTLFGLAPTGRRSRVRQMQIERPRRSHRRAPACATTRRWHITSPATRVPGTDEGFPGAGRAAQVTGRLRRVDYEIEGAEFAGGTPGLIVRGELDLVASPALKESLGKLIDAGATVGLIDLTEATFVDSTVLGALIGANRRFLSRDGALVLVCDNPSIRTIFTLTRLDRVFEIFDTVDQAEAAILALKESRAIDSAV
jgi:anti-sigma B factor antagonist